MGHENGGVRVAPRDFADLGELVVLAKSVEENWEAPLVGGLIDRRVAWVRDIPLA